MQNKFRVTGMSAPRSFTFFHYTNWWAVSGLSDEGYNSLFKWAKTDDDFWKQNVQAVVEHEGLASDGTPINGKVIEIIIT